MKKFLLFFLGTFSLVTLFAQPPAGPATKGMTFGEKINEKGSISVVDLSVKVNDEKEIPVKVRGRDHQ